LCYREPILLLIENRLVLRLKITPAKCGLDSKSAPTISKLASLPGDRLIKPGPLAGVIEVGKYCH
jgi:hypothetical protein